MNPFRSVGALLTIALSLVVAVALLIVYFMVVPSLQHRLITNKLSQLSKQAPKLQVQLNQALGNQATSPLQDFVDSVVSEINADRAATLTGSSQGVLVQVSADTKQNSDEGLTEDSTALEAYRTSSVSQGIVVHHGKRYAEMAVPAFTASSVLLIQDNLESQYQTIHVVKRRLLIAGLVGLLVALGVGYGGTWAFARRIKRLERAADRISSGRFDEPVADDSLDELGELARAFDRMRLRLAQLDDARREFIANASHELRTPLSPSEASSS